MVHTPQAKSERKSMDSEERPVRRRGGEKRKWQAYVRDDVYAEIEEYCDRTGRTRGEVLEQLWEARQDRQQQGGNDG